MRNIEGLSDNEMRELIVKSLKGVHIDPELISIKVKKGSKVVLGGEIDSRREKALVVQTIMDIVGIEGVVDEMKVMDGRYGDPAEDDDSELYDEDNQCIGTEDAYQAIEDGMPYIPPTTSPVEELDERPRHKKEGRNFDMDW
ncbi:MAG: BON domain-containing protein [Candidatus Omnitrophica bacterium]|nr:BON domain-containing protein [Candidatus Omnitrophota bacterium]MBU1128920.1 BON domain-containing protein [Candidatus Omnitrophota bacterium]MBU1784918.1 BON domain-containing protein [Candidatus Omnitrophota bacterium]MBU1852090.1 BON domain-containing protein [Candidatus Omnitrophota bacterium]